MNCASSTTLPIDILEISESEYSDFHTPEPETELSDPSTLLFYSQPRYLWHLTMDVPALIIAGPKRTGTTSLKVALERYCLEIKQLFQLMNM